MTDLRPHSEVGKAGLQPGPLPSDLCSFYWTGQISLHCLPWALAIMHAHSAVKMAGKDPAGIGNFSRWVALRLPCSLEEGNEGLIKYSKHPCLWTV